MQREIPKRIEITCDACGEVCDAKLKAPTLGAYRAGTRVHIRANDVNYDTYDNSRVLDFCDVCAVRVAMAIDHAMNEIGKGAK